MSVLAPICVSRALADENDLDRIPQAANQPETSAPAPSEGRKLYLQNDVIASGLRKSLLVPLPPSPSSDWEERLFLDARVEWRLNDKLRVTYSGRLNFRAEDGLAFPSHENIRHDLREAYLSFEPADGTFIDIGRINFKSGVALGFNPTDFFKTRAVVEPLSSDPSVLREDRLGTLMLLGEKVWEGGAVTVVFAPKLANESAIYANNNLPSLDPMIDRSSAHARLLVKGSFNLAEDLSPEILFYDEDGNVHFGANLTRGFGQAVVAYAEWAGGSRASVVDDAIRYGRATGVIPSLAPVVIPESANRSFQNDLSLGASYTTQTKITFNLEYHFHQAGFSYSDWRNWFAVGAANPHALPVIGELWYIRSYAGDQQEPLARHSLFLRADWQDAFVRDLELAGFVNADLRDRSGIAQLTADYYLSREWTLGALASATLGGKRTDFGSLPGAASVLVKVSRYF